VQWKFINVSEIYKLGELIDGAELYSRINEIENADTYIELVNKKADGIIHSNSHELLQLV
jgi:bisphosphoglycerate-independent phosphoglycerate mutase (AlkP superfamily)